MAAVRSSGFIAAMDKVGSSGFMAAMAKKSPWLQCVVVAPWLQ